MNVSRIPPPPEVLHRAEILRTEALALKHAMAHTASGATIHLAINTLQVAYGTAAMVERGYRPEQEAEILELVARASARLRETRGLLARTRFVPLTV